MNEDELAPRPKNLFNPHGGKTGLQIVLRPGKHGWNWEVSNHQHRIDHRLAHGHCKDFYMATQEATDAFKEVRDVKNCICCADCKGTKSRLHICCECCTGKPHGK